MQDTLRNHQIWRVEHLDQNMGLCLDWFVTEREADQQIRILLDADPDMAKPTKRAMAIPQSRKGLVRWLNAHFETDNG